MMVARFLRDQARWRLDSPGVSAIRAARSALALLDAAVCVEGLPDQHPDLAELDRAGCFRGGVFDPGQAGLAVVRGWELTDRPTGSRHHLLAALAVAARAPVPASAPQPPSATVPAPPRVPLPASVPLPVSGTVPMPAGRSPGLAGWPAVPARGWPAVPARGCPAVPARGRVPAGQRDRPRACRGAPARGRAHRPAAPAGCAPRGGTPWRPTAPGLRPRHHGAPPGRSQTAARSPVTLVIKVTLATRDPAEGAQPDEGSVLSESLYGQKRQYLPAQARHRVDRQAWAWADRRIVGSCGWWDL